MFKIDFLNKVSSNLEGYTFLISIIKQIKDEKESLIIFDFKECISFEANLCAVLGAIINESQNRFNNLKIYNLTPEIENIFNKNNFSASFEGKLLDDESDSTIKYRKNKLTDEKVIKEFLNYELIKKNDFPILSPLLEKEIIRSIFEIYSNAILHGNCNYVYSCGQYYKDQEIPRIDFTIVDLGNTIKFNVNSFLKKELSGKEAIEWAVLENNTTKPVKDNIPGGLGFKLICDFVKINKGKIQIISSDGFWEQVENDVTSKDFINVFPGTIINIEFNLKEKALYYLSTETIDDIIF